ncbi:MAG: DUF111 family protein [Desulfovibrio desulfuricans]|nr:DUF111 family protein [Desulfovibrio desulfuricans]
MDIFFDCAGGVSGHAALAALARLGVAFRPLEDALAAAGAACRIALRPETRDAGPGFRADVVWDAAARPPRTPAAMAALAARMELAPAVRAKTAAVLDALVTASAAARGIPREDVMVAEEDADMAALIPGVCYALEQLGARRLTASALPWSSGTVERGGIRVPLPAPVTAQLLLGKPVFSSGSAEELVTPLGAALLDALADAFVPGPQGVPAAMGTGYGPGASGGGLRAWLVRSGTDAADHARGGREPVAQLETHLDHLNGEDLGLALTDLAAMPEVLDVLWLPGVGKKNRPAGLLRVLCLPRHRDVVAGAVVRHTHTLGLRLQTLERLVLPRTAARLRLAGETLAAKRYTVEGRDYVRPEADSLAETARRLGVGAPALRHCLPQGE